MPPKGSKKSVPATPQKSAPKPKPAPTMEDPDSEKQHDSSQDGSESETSEESIKYETPKTSKTSKTAKSTPKVDGNATPKPTPKPKPKKVKEASTFTNLSAESGTPVDITFEGESSVAKMAKSGGGYTHMILLKAPASFEITNTVNLPEGHQYGGMQAILIRPAKAFPFLKLTPEMRKMVYEYYLAGPTISSTIVLDGKRKVNKETWAKTYSDGNRYRVAVLAVNKEINAEATPLLYDHPIKADNTNVLLDFLVQIDSKTVKCLTSIRIKTLTKSSARQAFHILAGATNLTKVQIDTGMASDKDLSKAVKNFWVEAYKFLENMAVHKSDKRAAIDLVSFGKNAFQYKPDPKGAVVPWSEAMIEEFRETLEGRLK